MKLLALVVAALLYEPSPDDHVRLGLPLEPAIRTEGPSLPRVAWRVTVDRLAYLQLCRSWRFDDGLGPVTADAAWRSQVWFHADDLANASYPHEMRLKAAKEIHRLIGPYDYYTGRLPAPWPGTKD